MRFKDVMENNTAELNKLYVYDMLTPNLIWEFVVRKGMDRNNNNNPADPKDPSPNVFIPNRDYLERNMRHIDSVYQQFRAESADADLEKALIKLFKVELKKENKDKDDEQQQSTINDL